MKKKLFLFFPKCETEKPIVYQLVKEFDLMVNIFRAKVTPEEYGFLVLDVTGSEENIKKGISFLQSFDVEINESQTGVRWNSEICIQCGNCVPHCPTSALHIADRKTMKVDFDSKECIDCLSCLKNCPYKACTSLF